MTSYWVADVMMPKMDGFTMVRQIRQVQTDPAPQTYRIGEFTFHPDTLRLDYAGTSEELSPREAKILEPDPRIRIVNVRGEGYKLLVNE